MATLKDEIYEVLIATELPVAYAHSDISQLPRFSYSLIYNGELRLSGQTHSKKPSYQIDYFSHVPEDVESFELFDTVREALRAKRIAVKNWQEGVTYDEDSDVSLFHYYLECEK